MYSFFLDGVVGKLFAREQSSGNEKRVNFLAFIYTLVYYHLMCAINIGVSVRLGANNDERESKTARKVFWLSFHFSRGQNRKPPSSVFLCSETKRKRLLRRLCVTGLALSLYGVFPGLLGQCIRQGSHLKGKEKYIRHSSERDNRET